MLFRMISLSIASCFICALSLVAANTNQTNDQQQVENTKYCMCCQRTYPESQGHPGGANKSWYCNNCWRGWSQNGKRDIDDYANQLRSRGGDK